MEWPLSVAKTVEVSTDMKGKIRFRWCYCERSVEQKCSNMCTKCSAFVCKQQNAHTVWVNCDRLFENGKLN